MDNDEERVMHNIEIIMNDKADGIIQELFHSLKNGYQNNSIMLIYCIINVAK